MCGTMSNYCKMAIVFALLCWLGLASATAGLANTPPMGWNSWNTFGCDGLSDQVVRGVADTFIDLGLHEAGYSYVNMDDCWMLKNRSNGGNGPQIPNPVKFPQGLPALISYVHSKGLNFGLYTARADHTCAGYAASCRHEVVDAQQYASWQVDYLKDDSCGDCRNPLSDYAAMQQAIDSAGRPIVLSIEGMPDITVVSKGGHGNARRVGHDIGASYLSMISLVDVGSGLHVYAHNDTGFGGFWNDLDMLEIGNGDFNADAGTPQKYMAQTHMSLWCIMKAPLLLGNDIRAMGTHTLAIVTNRAALSLTNDALGIQGWRVAVTLPAGSPLALPQVGQVYLGKCAASQQRWRLRRTGGTANLLFVTTCNASNPYQQWRVGSTPGPLRNVGNNQCADWGVQVDPGRTAPCVADRKEQQWALDSAGHISSQSVHCLDVYDYSGPDVEMGYCKQPGASDDNQVFSFDPATGLIRSHSSQLDKDQNCLVAASGPDGYQLYTTDTSGAEYCLYRQYSDIGGWQAVPCSDGRSYNVELIGDTKKPGVQPFRVAFGGNDLGWDETFGASGPVPHSRYLVDRSWPWLVDFAAALTSEGSVFSLKSGTNITDDDSVGNVGVAPSEDFCLTLGAADAHEVWVAPLVAGRWGVALVNRGATAQLITAQWSLFTSTTRFAVHDVWAQTDRGLAVRTFTALVPPLGTVLLICTPA
eukprot:m.235436 g.235436  ORF g.235436 m.235436 type:complete len:700 (-) comp20068_c0_seq1:45-2144(-)